jgi:hypothetical protein
MSMAERCPTRKIRYLDESAAKVALVSARAANVLRRYGRAKTEQRVYQCDRCDGWHLTSQS